MGDGVLAYFGWPKAHENDAERAVHAALDILRSIKTVTAPGGEPLRIRIGIATGLVIVGDLIGEGAAQEEAVVGETPNLAARLQDIAAPGEVVIAGTTRKLIGNAFELSERGNHELKGIPGKTVAFAVTGERPVESRFEARLSGQVGEMVGRDHELGLIIERWQQSRKGDGQLALLTGEGRFRTFTAENSGLDSHQIIGLGQSRDGMLWVSTFTALHSGGKAHFVRHDQDTGLADSYVHAFAETAGGETRSATPVGISSARTRPPSTNTQLPVV